MTRAAIAFALILATGLTVRAESPAPLHDAIERQARSLAAAAAPQQAPAQNPAQNAPQERSWVARHKVLTGTLIGLGVGAVIGAATCSYPTAEGSSCSDYTYPSNARMLGALTIGAFGAGIGAGIGAIIVAIER